MNNQATEGEENTRHLIAYALPFGVFMGMTLLEGPLIYFYPFLYAAKVLFVCIALWMGRKYWPQFDRKGLGLGVLVGAIGLPVWVLLSSIDLTALLPAFLVGKRSGGTEIFNLEPPAFKYSFIAVRLFGLAVVVPIMEELFWRGFLIRFLVAEPFQKVPLGKYTPMSFAVVTLLFVAAHPEILAALVWGAAINLLFYRTKNLWACVAMHMTTNALLGVYILSTGAWQLW